MVRRRHRSASADGGTAWRASPQADGGTAWRSAAAHRHHTRLRIPKQVGKFVARPRIFWTSSTRPTSRRSWLPRGS